MVRRAPNREMEKTSVIAKKPAAASVHLSRRIGVPSLSSNAGVISAPTVTAIHRSRLTPSRFAVCRPFPRIPKINSGHLRFSKISYDCEPTERAGLKPVNLRAGRSRAAVASVSEHSAAICATSGAMASEEVTQCSSIG
jgi:hypothetical protein